MCDAEQQQQAANPNCMYPRECSTNDMTVYQNTQPTGSRRAVAMCLFLTMQQQQEVLQHQQQIELTWVGCMRMWV